MKRSVGRLVEQKILETNHQKIYFRIRIYDTVRKEKWNIILILIDSNLQRTLEKMLSYANLTNKSLLQ